MRPLPTGFLAEGHISAGSGRVWLSLHKVIMVAIATLSQVFTSGCLVTDNASLPHEPNYPPSIITSQREEHIRRVDLSADPSGEVVFEDLAVREVNLTQTLQYAVFIDRISTDPISSLVELLDSGEIAPTDDEAFERPFSVEPIPHQELAVGCHKIELFVSGELTVLPSRGVRWTPIIPGDIDRKTWWIEVTDAATLTVGVDQCPN